MIDHTHPMTTTDSKNCNIPSRIVPKLMVLLSLEVFLISVSVQAHPKAEIIVPEPGNKMFITKQIMCQGDFSVAIKLPEQMFHSPSDSVYAKL